MLAILNFIMCALFIAGAVCMFRGWRNDYYMSTRGYFRYMDGIDYFKWCTIFFFAGLVFFTIIIQKP